jgi:HEAT repeat protein
MRRPEASRILSSFKSDLVSKTLVRESLDTLKSREYRAGVAEVLASSKTLKVDFGVFQKLLSDRDPLIRRASVDGLYRFPPYEVKVQLLLLVYDLDGWTQGEAIRLLGDFDLLGLIATENAFPKRFVIDPLFEQIRKYNLVEFIPIMNKVKKKWLSPEERPTFERELANLAHTYFILGRQADGLQIVNSFYTDGRISFYNDYACADLVEICPVIGEAKGLEILKDIYKLVQTCREKPNSFFKSGFIDELVIASLQSIGNDAALDFLISLCEEAADKKSILLIERTLRSIESLYPKSREDWLIKLIESHPDLKGADLHRAIEALGFIGAEKSIALIKKVANNNADSEYILDSCLIAIESINIANGKLVSSDFASIPSAFLNPLSVISPEVYGGEGFPQLFFAGTAPRIV